MAYAEPKDLLRRERASDLAEAAAPEAPVSGELLALTIKAKDEAADVSDYTTGEQAAATLARATLVQILADASAEIDSWISGRYGALDKTSEVLRGRCLDIAIYRLFGGEADSERYLLYKQAVNWLSSVAARKIDLFQRYRRRRGTMLWRSQRPQGAPSIKAACKIIDDAAHLLDRKITRLLYAPRGRCCPRP